MYRYVIFDVDDTLLDFESAFRDAQKNIAIKLGIGLSKEYMQLDDKTGWRAWKESGLDNTESEDVQRNYHTYYHQYLRNHYLYLKQELGLDIDTRAQLYDEVQKMTLKDVVDFQQKWFKDRTYYYEILGDKKELDMEALKKLGTVIELKTADIFGY